MKKSSEFNRVISILQELNTSFPSYNLGRHLATALDEYGDLWGVTDKEMVFALMKYKSQLEMDVPHKEEEEIDEIIKGGMNLDSLFKDEDNGDY
jgi:hypothetical protein